MKPEKNKFKLFIGRVFLLGTLLALFTLVLCLFVDPYGAWFENSFAGFNQYKYGQKTDLRTYKPYAFARSRPENILIGSSRVCYGIPVKELGSIENSYNFGIDSMYLGEIEALVRYMANLAEKPLNIFIGLDFFMFTQSDEQDVKNLDAYGNRLDLSYFLIKKITKTIFSLSAIENSLKTIFLSLRKDPGEVPFEQGWGKWRDNGLNKESYRAFMWQFLTKTYADISYDPLKIDKLQEIVDYASKHNIQIFLFITPIYADLLMEIEANNLWPTYERWKKDLVKIGPYIDFSGVNQFTIDRKNYVDPSHFTGNLGNIVARDLCLFEKTYSDKQLVFGTLVNRDSCNEYLDKQNMLFEEYKNKNQQLLEEMKIVLKNGSKDYFDLNIMDMLPFDN